MTERPLIVAIKRHSFEDGPGIRSVVFFKGCPLRCVFCHNPEAQRRSPQLLFHADRCIACNACVTSCPSGLREAAGAISTVRPGCLACGECAAACPSSALRLAGTYYSPADLANALLRDARYFRPSNGGVTLSGGECTLFPDYLEELLVSLKRSDIHIVVETCGDFDAEAVRRCVLPWVDVIYFDVKFADPVIHRRYTGSDNRRILRNLAWLLREMPGRILPRVPLVPGITTTDENLRGIARLLRQMGADSVELLPYNPLGRTAAERLGRSCPAVPEGFMSAEDIEAARRRFTEFACETTETKGPVTEVLGGKGEPHEACCVRPCEDP
jgi:pyruvate formate lyase activating enzyme